MGSQGSTKETLNSLLGGHASKKLVAFYRDLKSAASKKDFGKLANNIIILDTETTGLSLYTCELTEIACVRIENGKVVEEFETLIKPKQPIPEEISQLTGITNADVVDAPQAEEAVQKLSTFVGENPIIAHNATFDRSFVEKVAGGKDVSSRWVDSLALSRIAFPLFKSHALGRMAEAFEIDEVTHRAMADVHALAGIWPIMLQALTAFPEGFLAQVAHMHPEVEWQYRFIFEQLAAGQTSNFSLKQRRAELVKERPKQEKFDSLGQELDLNRVDPKEVIEAFRPEGLVSNAFKKFEPREEQASMASMVTDALNSSSNLAIEVGTGVGKSMAYLLPLALFARANNLTCGVATKTNMLTDQIMQSELPRLSEALSGLSYAALKGYEHYPCLRKTLYYKDSALPLSSPANETREQAQSDMLTAIAVTMAYASCVAQGDIDGLGIRWSNVPRGMLTTTANECKRHKCPFFKAGCFVQDARRAAQSADIVVTNHSLLLCDIASSGRILPTVRQWAIDEAHSFEDEARKQWALEMRQEPQVLDLLGDEKKGVIHRLITSLAKQDGGQPPQGLLSKAAGILKTIQPLFFEVFDEAAAFARAHKQGNPNFDAVQVWVNEDLRQLPEFAHIAALGAELSLKLREVNRAFQSVIIETKEMQDVSTAELTNPLRTLQTWQETLDTFFQDAPNSQLVYSISAPSKKRLKNHAPMLKIEQLLIGPQLIEKFYEETQSVTYCSATLAMGDDFTHFKESIGFDELPSDSYRTTRLSSPYDLDQNMSAVFVEGMPDPNQGEAYVEVLTQTLKDIHLASNGGVLTLFTNRKDMEAVYKRIKSDLEENHLDLQRQTPKSNPYKLRQNFINNKKASLFALKSFWEGFDAPGDTLKCVVIPKLPFTVPTDPLAQARTAQFSDAWRRFFLPEAVLTFKQAVGRLVRSSTDTGMVIVCDPRIFKKAYGKNFREAVPTNNQSNLHPEEMSKYIELWSKSRE